jgi:hypothetical protein
MKLTKEIMGEACNMHRGNWNAHKPVGSKPERRSLDLRRLPRCDDNVKINVK